MAIRYQEKKKNIFYFRENLLFAIGKSDMLNMENIKLKALPRAPSQMVVFLQYVSPQPGAYPF